MQRREIIRQLFFGTISAKAVLSSAVAKNPVAEKIIADTKNKFQSKWHLLPDMPWTGEDVWAQRLQDWCVKNGELHCLVHGQYRTINVLTHQLSDANKPFRAELILRFTGSTETGSENENYAGFRLGIKGRFADYRSAIFTGKGINTGITRNGHLFIGTSIGEQKIEEKILTREIRLVLTVTPVTTGGNFTKLRAMDKTGNTLAIVSTHDFDTTAWKGNIAVISHFKPNKNTNDQTSVIINKFCIEGDKLDYQPHQFYGPIYFAQYTQHNSILKLTAQFAPMDIANAEAFLQIKKGNTWKIIASAKIHPLARTANFRSENWDASRACSYRVSYYLNLRNGNKKQYTYEGTIAAEPVQKSNIKALAFSCNWDLGFPDNEVVENASIHNADLIFFLGDQFYEANGGFSVQTSPLEKSCLDYLRKWYMFGWSYRTLFQNKPMVALPDDHDVYHGNVWGAGGRAAMKSGGAAARQDSGGYKMPADWVNMAQLTQTSHMPDAYDPAPVLQGINVYYNIWEYAGISFGIIEDRKFKSAPKDVLPEEAKVFNGFVQNPEYDHSKIKNLEAHLLGERQVEFLSDWSNSQNKMMHFKVLVSATPFCCLQTLPSGTKDDEITPSLAIPEKGEYVTGDMPTQDMDSNGWPHNRRDEVLRLLDKKIDLHLVGDQHLASVVQYGVNEYADSMYCFTVPALNNIWPRRWWPALSASHQSLPGKPGYTGNFKDGFGNKITVHAAANPFKHNMQPSLLYDRVTGYGVVEFDKAAKKITLNCWPRYIKPDGEDNGQYDGWPITFQTNNKQ